MLKFFSITVGSSYVQARKENYSERISRHKYFTRHRFDSGTPSASFHGRATTFFDVTSEISPVFPASGNLATRDKCRTHVDYRIKPFVKLSNAGGSSEFLDAPIAGIDSLFEPEVRSEDVG